MTPIREKLRDLVLETTVLKQLFQSKDSHTLKSAIVDELMKSQQEALSKTFNLVDASRPTSLLARTSFSFPF